ncbi:MAG: hypothetical protein ABSG65_04700 [Bryobacteraceae bacterium]
MEIELFPVYDSGLNLQNALSFLKQENRSAIVVQEGNSYALAEVPDMVIAAAEKTATELKQLTTLVPLTVLPFSAISEGLLDFRNPSTISSLERYLDALQQRFVILAVTPARALVASRHEPDMTPLQASPQDCYCKIDRKPVSPGVRYGNCPHDSKHVGTVRCY